MGAGGVPDAWFDACRGTLHALAAAGALQHASVIWSQSGCKPDLELLSRRYCILSWGYKFKTLPRQMHWQPGALPPQRRPRRGRSTWQSYDLGLAASLTWSCRLGVTVLALQQYGDARCRPPTAGDWGPQLATKTAGPRASEGHSNNLKCLTSGLKVRSFPPVLLQWCLLWIILSKFIKQRFSSDDNKWQIMDFLSW